MKRKVLIVEDDKAMGVALRDGFTYEGYDVTFAADGAEAIRLAADKNLDIMILDVMLPKMSGLDVCKELRNAGKTLPIIMLTARGQEIDRVVGLKLGADDYVTKPFSFMELLARVEAVLRRASNRNASKQTPKIETYEFGDVMLDFKRHRATKADRPLELSGREYHLLHYFIKHKDEVVTRDQLLDAVWGMDGAPLTRTVDMHIAKLRQKIEDDPTDPHHIITMHRIGYRFAG